MLLIGSHVGFNKESQILGSLEEALSYKANTFMFYTGAPQNTVRSQINDEKSKIAFSRMQEEQIDPTKIVVHAPYIFNLCNEEKFDFSVAFLKSELQRVNELGLKYIVVHPGSHVGIGIDKGIENISKGLNLVLNEVKDNNVTILLETMAGKGTEVGSNLEEIQRIIEKITDKEHIGVCLDTCHLNDAGYDLDNFDEFLDKFDKIIGINKIGCVHVNDSKNEKNSHKDRHENIGFGTIGFDKLIKIIYNKRLEDIPKILETPYVDRKYAPYKYEIEMIRQKEFNDTLIDKIKKES